MGASYYVNSSTQTNGDHEVHNSGCSYLPDEQNRIHLGYFNNCWDAVSAAKAHYDQVNGCYWCSRECHTS